MKTYVLTSGAVFGLLTAAHLWRIFAEDPRLAQNTFFVGITAAAAGLSLWAGVVLWRSSRS